MLKPQQKKRWFTWWSEEEGCYLAHTVRVPVVGRGETADDARMDLQRQYMDCGGKFEDDTQQAAARLSARAKDICDEIGRAYGFNRSQLFEFFIYREYEGLMNEKP